MTVDNDRTPIAPLREYPVYTVDALIQKILDDDKQYDLSKIVSAYETADHYHADQKRESGEPYITHPVTVAYILLELGMDKIGRAHV